MSKIMRVRIYLLRKEEEDIVIERIAMFNNIAPRNLDRIIKNMVLPVFKRYGIVSEKLILLDPSLDQLKEN